MDFRPEWYLNVSELYNMMRVHECMTEKRERVSE
jgi:hypothetical protein